MSVSAYALETRGLKKSFRGRVVIDGLDLHVPRGEINGFIVKNGSGKSTTMKLVCGLMPPSAGEVLVMGEALAPCEASAAIGSIIEAPGIYPGLSAFDNMMVKALALGLVDARLTCDELLRAVGLGEHCSTGPRRREKAKRFSMGMKQRVGLALALLGGPDVLLLDEPLNGLDPEGARAIRELIVRLNRERGVTVLISSHVLDQLERICTRYGVIREGRMVRELTAEDVERECASCLVLRCSEPARALAAIEECLPAARLSVLPDDAIRIDGEVEAARVGALLMDQGIAVSDLHRQENDIEEFFVGLMGGSEAPDGAPDGGASGRIGGRIGGKVR